MLVLEESLAHSGAPYIKPAVMMLTRQAIVDLLVLSIRQLKVDFDTIAVRGLSGLLIGPMLASKLEKRLLVIRKEEDGSHSGCSAEGHSRIEKYIIVDDLISTGETMRCIVDGVSKVVHEEVSCQFIFCCNSCRRILPTYSPRSSESTPIPCLVFGWNSEASAIINFGTKDLLYSEEFLISSYTFRKMREWFRKVALPVLKKDYPSI